MTNTKSNKQGRHIPTEIKRQVLLEAGHMCAIPTCQWQATEFSHIEPFSKVKKHEVSNIIALCPNHHDQYDNKKTIDRKSIRVYKLKLQFLNKRYTKYEMRLLALLAEKSLVVVNGEIQVLGLLNDGLIENARTFMTQGVSDTDSNTGQVVFSDTAVMIFAARLTEKGTRFIKTWQSQSGELLDNL